MKNSTAFIIGGLVGGIVAFMNRDKIEDGLYEAISVVCDDEDEMSEFDNDFEDMNMRGNKSNDNDVNKGNGAKP